MIDLATIRSGLTRGEFFLEYLPTVSLIDDSCIGAEALIRWRHAGEIIPPNEFIPRVENTSLSGLITYWVLERIAVEMGDWLRENGRAHIGLNVPPEILGRGGMEYVANKSGLIDRASQIVFEITERGVPDPLGVDAINQSRLMGIQVALDDVTLVGAANLAVLARCNFDAIKLDKSLVDEITPHRAIPDWLNLLTHVLASSSLHVIAEGVETAHQAATLRAANIQGAQGYYFSRPIPAAPFMAFYRDRGMPGRTALPS